MLHFGQNPDEASRNRHRREGTSRRLRWRLWMLLIALGLVMAIMRQLKDPNTAQRLGQIFSPDAETSHSQADEVPVILGANESETESQVSATEAEQEKSTSPELPDDGTEDALALVKDNTYFRPAENKAWFELFDRLQHLDKGELRELTVGELTYSQLLKQPKVYRGKVVTIRGVLRREEVETAPENSLGIESYHRLIIQPRGGGNWPFVVYCLNLPEELPRGENLQSRISVTGFFFKNWSYAWQDGLGVAPVVLASGVEWQPSAPASPRRTLRTFDLRIVLLVAGCFATAVVWLVLRNTRRPQRSAGSYAEVTLPDEDTPTETVHEQMQRLSAGEIRE